MTGVHAATSFFGSLAVAATGVLVLARFSGVLGLVDEPDARKQHDHPVPLVGGLAVFIALLAATAYQGMSTQVAYFTLALALVIAIGMWDDVRELRPRVKFAIQIVACMVMIFAAGVELASVGDLLGFRPIGLWILGIPLTIFATIGVVNSVNMMDGLDGLAGSIAAVAFAWYAFVAAREGLPVQFHTALILAGALGGFLLFNLRFPWQPRARVFLGDAGSLMVGFALAWFAIDLSQGAGRTFPPIAALWVLMLPLADCVSLMARRLRAGKSPFVADRAHIHHYLLARGFSHTQTMAILVAASVLFGAVGYFGWALHLPEAALFYPFFFGFFTYHFVMRREWRRIERLGHGADPSGLPTGQSPQAV